jgi:hypothetical protein
VRSSVINTYEFLRLRLFIFNFPVLESADDLYVTISIWSSNRVRSEYVCIVELHTQTILARADDGVVSIVFVVRTVVESEGCSPAVLFLLKVSSVR